MSAIANRSPGLQPAVLGHVLSSLGIAEMLPMRLVCKAWNNQVKRLLPEAILASGVTCCSCVEAEWADCYGLPHSDVIAQHVWKIARVALPSEGGRGRSYVFTPVKEIPTDECAAAAAADGPLPGSEVRIFYNPRLCGQAPSYPHSASVYFLPKKDPVPLGVPDLLWEGRVLPHAVSLCRDRPPPPSAEVYDSYSCHIQEDEYADDEPEQGALMGKIVAMGIPAYPHLLMRSKPGFWHQDLSINEELLGTYRFFPFSGSFLAGTDNARIELDPDEFEDVQRTAGPVLIHGYFGQVLLDQDAPEAGRRATAEEVKVAKKNRRTKAEKVAFAGVSVLVLQKVVMSERMVLKRLAALGALNSPWEEVAQARELDSTGDDEGSDKWDGSQDVEDYLAGYQLDMFESQQ